MRKFAAFGAAILFAAASMGTAVPARAQAVAPVPFVWTGGYVGVFMGAAYHQAWWDELDDDWWDGTEKASSGGVYVGPYAGFNFQSGPFLYGLEADVGLATNKAVDNLSDGEFDDRETNDLNWLATFRARTGIAQDRFLLFVTGGLAVADFDTFMTSSDFPTEVYTASGVRVGWVAGGGLEYPLRDNLSLRIEVLYHDFGSNTYQQPSNPDDRDEISNTVVTGRVGLTAHLDWPS